MHHGASWELGLQSTVALVATDFSISSDHALQRALILLRRQVGTLLLTHVEAPVARPPVGQRGSASHELERLRNRVRTIDRVPCSSVLREGRVAEHIRMVAGERQASLILLGPHHRRPLIDAWQSTTAEMLSRTTSVPILVTNARPGLPYKRAIVATDLRPLGADLRRMLGRALGSTSFALCSLHVVDDLGQQMLARSLASGLERSSLARDQQAHARGSHKKWMQAHGLCREHSITRTLKGCIAAQIAEAAEEQDADLIIIPKFRKSLMARLLVGSTTSRLLKIATRDILILPIAAHRVPEDEARRARAELTSH